MSVCVLACGISMLKNFNKQLFAREFRPFSFFSYSKTEYGVKNSQINDNEDITGVSVF
jgi:hypothetical protein